MYHDYNKCKLICKYRGTCFMLIFPDKVSQIIVYNHNKCLRKTSLMLRGSLIKDPWFGISSPWAHLDKTKVMFQSMSSMVSSDMCQQMLKWLVHVTTLSWDFVGAKLFNRPYVFLEGVVSHPSQGYDPFLLKPGGIKVNVQSGIPDTCTNCALFSHQNRTQLMSCQKLTARFQCSNVIC